MCSKKKRSRHRQKNHTLFLDFLFMQTRERRRFIIYLMLTFFLCSFCRSLNCSILFISSFRWPESRMCKFPIFSISEKLAKQTSLKKSSEVKSMCMRNALKQRYRTHNLCLRFFISSKDTFKVLLKQKETQEALYMQACHALKCRRGRNTDEGIHVPIPHLPDRI